MYKSKSPFRDIERQEIGANEWKRKIIDTNDICSTAK